MSTTQVRNRALARHMEVADLVHSSSLRLLRLLRLQDKASGIGPAQLSALSVLVFGGPCSLKQLASYEQVRPPTMSRIVAGLQEAGFVQRRASAEDRRSIVLTPTARGRKVMQAGRKRRVCYLADRLKPMSASELGTLAGSAKIILRILQR